MFDVYAGRFLGAYNKYKMQCESSFTITRPCCSLILKKIGILISSDEVANGSNGPLEPQWFIREQQCYMFEVLRHNESYLEI